MKNSIEILGEVAKLLGKGTRPCNCFDAMVCSFTVTNENKWIPVAESGFPFTRELRTDYKGRRINLMANPDFFMSQMKGSLTADTYSIGQPGIECFKKQPYAWIQIVGRRVPVFLATSSDKPRNRGLRPSLNDPALTSTVSRLLLGKSESLHLFEGAVKLYHTPSTPNDAIAALDILSELVGVATGESELDSVDFSVLPTGLHGLVPYIRKWAISDDAERASLLDEASLEQLEELVSAVSEYLPQINRYLDSFGNQGPSEMAAIALQTLGECSVEAHLKLKAMK